MCGLTGIINTKEGISLSELKNAGSKLKHRGPDDSGIFISVDNKIGLAHQRLSFIDLSSNGKQPLTNTEKTVTVLFNGEIYNYLDLKKALEKKGYEFITQTDTEVLIHGYSEWKSDLPKYLEGMFAICILDHKNQKLILIRDRFGIKPLFYGVFDNIFAFGSEIKAIFEYKKIPKVILKRSVSLFLANRYVPTPLTMWEGIYKMKPASIIEIDNQTLIRKESCYWKLEFGENKENEKDFTGKMETLLKKSIREHQIADVEIGTFLSGGIDSSLILGNMKVKKESIQAFTIGFENWQNSEHLPAEIIAKEANAKLQECILNENSFDELEKIIYYYDDPIADISIIPTYKISQLASKNVKAVLSGEGADELFAGYNWQKPGSFHYKTRLSKFRSRFLKHSFKQIKTHYIHSMSMGLFDNSELKKAFHNNWQKDIPFDPFLHFNQFNKKKLNTLKQIQFLDINCFMQDLVLQKIDRASMANSLEVRVPFLNNHIFEYVFSVRSSVYFDANTQKKPLQQLLKKIYKTKVYNRPKQGFVGPDNYYMNYKIYEEQLLDGVLVKGLIINKNYIESLIESKDHWRLWKLLVLEKWWKINVI